MINMRGVKSAQWEPAAGRSQSKLAIDDMCRSHIQCDVDKNREKVIKYLACPVQWPSGASDSGHESVRCASMLPAFCGLLTRVL